MICRTEETNKKIEIRLNKIEGQLKGIKNMLYDDRDCLEIMTQIQSASAALKSIWEILSAHHLENCINNCNDEQERKIVIEQIIKGIKELR